MLCNLLDPHTKNPNYTFKVRAYAVNFFLLDLFAFPKSFFLSLGINSALFLAGRGFRKIPEVQEVHFKAFQGACETRVSLEYFLVKVTLFVANFLVHVSLNGMGWVWFCKDLVPLHKLSVKVDNYNPRSQSSLSCFKKERFSLGARERTLETRLDNDR